MRILFVCPVAPQAPVSGSTIQTYHFIRFLSKRHQVGVWAFGQAEASPGPLAYLHLEPPPASSRWRLRRRWLSGEDPMSRWGFDGERFSPSIDASIGTFSPDVVVFDGLQSAWPLLEWAGKSNRPRLVYNAHDAVHVILRRSLTAAPWTPRFWLELRFARSVKAQEARLAAAADCCLCVSEEDSRALGLESLARRRLVVPNGVDTERFQVLPEDPASNRLIFTGSLSYGPNRQALLYYAEKIRPKMAAARPGVKLIVVGAVPPDLEFLRQDEGFELVGFQSDVRPFYRRAAASVVPLLAGSGTRFKILESWAMGRPVVSTKIGAEGLPAAHRVNLLIADDPADFASRIVELLEDRALGRDLARSGRRLVEERFGWDLIVAPLERAFQSLVAEKAS